MEEKRNGAPLDGRGCCNDESRVVTDPLRGVTRETVIIKVKRVGAGNSAAREAIMSDLESRKDSNGVADSRADRRLDVT